MRKSAVALLLFVCLAVSVHGRNILQAQARAEASLVLLGSGSGSVRSVDSSTDGGVVTVTLEEGATGAVKAATGADVKKRPKAGPRRRQGPKAEAAGGAKGADKAPAIAKQSVETEPAPKTGGDAAVGGESVSKCPSGSFFKPFDESCMECDENCLPGECADEIGCGECADGFFTSRADPEWPNLCQPCTIDNCDKCRDDIFDAWPVQCVKCAEGFEQANNRKECVAVGDEPDVAGITTSKGDETVDVVDQSTDATEVGGQTSTKCPSGSFFKPFDESCMECDENCLPGECADEIGCGECADGFFTSRADPEWPNLCKPCTIDNCDKCRDDIFDAWPVQCVKCAEGFEQANNRKECVAVGDEPDVAGITTSKGDETVDVVDQSTDDGAVGGESKCPDGSFFKPFDSTCMECDENCLPGECADKIGCGKCADGFFTSREDLEWPFRCKPCVIKNCNTCRDDIFDAWPVQCVKCAKGFEPANNKKECVAVGDEPDVAGITTSKGDETVDVVDQSTDGGAVGGESTCPEGSFFKPFDSTCMECDKKCLPGECVDVEGCRKCRPGFYRSSPDPEWPFTCIKCDSKIPNCASCMDGVFDAWPVKCDRCKPGFELVDKREACVPV